MLRVESKSVAQLAKRLERVSTNLPRDMRRTMVSAQRGARTEATRAARQVYTVKAQKIATEWKVSNVDTAALAFTLTGLRRPLGLFNYDANRGAKGIYAAVKRDGKRVVIARSFGALSGGTLVPFQRVGRARLPIRALKGPSPADILANPLVHRDLGAKFLQRTERELVRLIRNAMAGKG